MQLKAYSGNIMRKRSVLSRVRVRIAILLLVMGFLFMGLRGQAYSWPWSKDMHDQPSIRPGELLLTPPEGTLPVKGGEIPMSKLEADEKLKNPVEPTEKSIAVGNKLFHIYCAVCHGKDAKGGGPVAKKFIPPPDLTSEFFKQRSDGFIYATIREGGAVMPPYGEDTTPRERWDLVNYLRKLQGK